MCSLGLDCSVSVCDEGSVWCAGEWRSCLGGLLGKAVTSELCLTCTNKVKSRICCCYVNNN